MLVGGSRFGARRFDSPKQLRLQAALDDHQGTRNFDPQRGRATRRHDHAEAVLRERAR